MSNITAERLRELADELDGIVAGPALRDFKLFPVREADRADITAALRDYADMLDRAAHEPCAECQRMREGLQLIATDKHRLMNITARQTAASILAGKPSGVTTPPPPDVQRAFERGCFVIMEMMKAYERRVRTDSTPEEIEKRPWECAEYVAAADYLRRVWPAQTKGGG